MKNKLARFFRLKRISLALLALLAIIAVGGTMYMKVEDRKFDAFRDNGAGINSYLSGFSRAMEEAVKTKSVEGLMAFYADDYASSAGGRGRFEKSTESNGVRHTWLEMGGTSDPSKSDFDRDDLKAEWEAYIKPISTVDGASVDGAKVPSDDPTRGLGVECKINITEEIIDGESATVNVKYILSGRDREGRTFQDRFFFRWWLRSTGEGRSDWEIVRDELVSDPEVSNLRVESEKPGFEVLDLVAAGLIEDGGGAYRHRRDPMLDVERDDIDLKFAVIQHAGGGVTTCDYDGDGWVDLFFSDGVESRLFRHEGLRSGVPAFRDVTGEVGLAGIGRVHSAIFADFDNDGDKDIFVARYDSPSLVFFGESLGTPAASGDPAAGYVFEDKTEDLGLSLTEPCVSACCIDYDRDGFVDIYVGVNGDAKNEVPRVPFFARNGKPNRLLRNVGGKKFEDVTEASGTGDAGWSLAVACGDLDGDGWVDLGVANDFGRKTIFRNNGDGTFRECAKEIGTLDFSGGMGIAFADVDGDGRTDIYTSNIYSNQRWLGEDKALLQYSRNLVRSKWFISDFGEYWDLYWITDGDWKSLGKMAGEGNSLFLNRSEDEEWKFDEARESCTNRAGWGWGGCLADLDNDTDLDIYAANGWITGQKADDL
jgi:hypothetical protein